MKRQFIVYNPIMQPLSVGDVGLFQPGENLVELTYEQEYLLKNNAILKMRMLKPKVVEPPKKVETPKEETPKAETPEEETPKEKETTFKVSTSKRASYR